MLSNMFRRNDSCCMRFCSFPIFVYAENLEVQKGGLMQVLEAVRTGPC
jgi:hypothetical protein